jgi:hypothetical protein
MFRTVSRIDERKRRDFMSTSQGVLTPHDISMKYEMINGRIVYQDLSSDSLATSSYENAMAAWKNMSDRVSKKVSVRALAPIDRNYDCAEFAFRKQTLVRGYHGYGFCAGTTYPNERLQFYYWADKAGTWSLYDCKQYYSSPSDTSTWYYFAGLYSVALKFGTATYHYSTDYAVDYEDYDKWPIASITLTEPGLIPVNMFIACNRYGYDLSYRFYIAHESDPFYKSRDLDFSRCYIPTSMLHSSDIE